MKNGLTLAGGCGTVESRKARLFGSSPLLVDNRQQIRHSGGYFLLFVFTFEVGKSCENSACYGGNAGHQGHNKINCHTHASFIPVFQLVPVEFRRQPPEKPEPSNGFILPQYICIVNLWWNFWQMVFLTTRPWGKEFRKVLG